MAVYVFNGVKAENFNGNVEADNPAQAEMLVSKYLHGTLSEEERSKVIVVRQAMECRSSVTEAAVEPTSGCCCKG